MFKYLCAGLCLFFASFAFAGERLITVSGSGSIGAVPDVAHVNLGVVSEHASLSAAMLANKKASANVFNDLKKKNVDEKDVCTKSFTVLPNYKYVKDQEPELIGYVVRNEVKVTIWDVNKVGEILDALTKEGHANLVTGVVFDVLNKSKYLDVAREMAVADALRKAKLLATAAGAKLGKVQTILEHEDYSHPYEARAMMDASASAHVATKGEQQYKVTVELVIALVD